MGRLEIFVSHCAVRSSRIAVQVSRISWFEATELRSPARAGRFRVGKCRDILSRNRGRPPRRNLMYVYPLPPGISSRRIGHPTVIPAKAGIQRTAKTQTAGQPRRFSENIFSHGKPKPEEHRIFALGHFCFVVCTFHSRIPLLSFGLSCASIRRAVVSTASTAESLFARLCSAVCISRRQST